MQAARRPRRTPEEARRLILSAAQELLADTGPKGLRLQEIAARAGISHPLILHHFGSREGLVRALVQEAAAELRDRLIAAMAAGDVAPAAQVERVFNAFRDGLAPRLAWLATVELQGPAAPEATALIMRDIADVLHAQRLATAGPDAETDRVDTQWMAHLVAVAAFGDALLGRRLRRSAGLSADDESDRAFRDWFAALIREHGKHRSEDEDARRSETPLVQPRDRST
jgi:AcrR family transcriptional regulator